MGHVSVGSMTRGGGSSPQCAILSRRLLCKRKMWHLDQTSACCQPGAEPWLACTPAVALDPPMSPEMHSFSSSMRVMWPHDVSRCHPLVLHEKVLLKHGQSACHSTTGSHSVERDSQHPLTSSSVWSVGKWRVGQRKVGSLHCP